MRYTISHHLTYTYDRPVHLDRHVLRLRPRCDITQKLLTFALEITPVPIRSAENLDLDGNPVLHLWLTEQPTESLTIQARSDVETYRTNPFDFLLEPWADHLPIDYPPLLLSQLQPYLMGHNPYTGLDPIAVQLAQDISFAASGNPVLFLSQLNEQIYQTCEYVIRDTGDPWPPGLTWRKQTGSCRDRAVLFMEVCRAAGLASRFVSGYQETDVDQESHLHAWAEVYLPGAGWRGYDSVNNKAIDDRFVALAASAVPSYAAPVQGALQKGSIAQSSLAYEVRIQPQ